MSGSTTTPAPTPKPSAAAKAAAAIPVPVTPVEAMDSARLVSNKLSAFLSTSLAYAGAAGKCRWHHAKAIGLSDAHRAAIAWIIAEEVIDSRGGLSRVKQLWLDSITNGTKLTGKDRERNDGPGTGPQALPGEAEDQGDADRPAGLRDQPAAAVACR